MALSLAGGSLVHAEGFENFDASSYKGFEVTEDVCIKGSKSLKMTSDVCSATFEAPKGSKVAVCWFFDNISNKNINTNALVKVGNTTIGVYGNVSTEKYLVKNTDDDAWVITDVARSGGWHQFVFDYSGDGAKLYIDGKIIKNFRTGSSVEGLRIYDQLVNGNVAGMCIDDVKFFESMKDVELSGSGAAPSATDYDFDNLMCGSVALKIGADIAYVKNYKTNIDVSPVIEDNRTYVPVRFLTEGFGGQVKWDNNKNVVNIIYGSKEIRMTVGEDWFWVNGEKVMFDAAPKIINSRTMVPVTAFANAIGLNICWDARGLVIITQPDVILEKANTEIINKIADLFDGVARSEVMARVYVSPEGDDENDGSESSPFKTINRAKDEVQKIIAKGMTGDIEVILGGGTYAENITFTEKDSGLGHYKVIYKNKEGESPVVYGGRVVSGWESYNDKIYKTHLGIEEFHMLTENGEMSTKARFPNSDYALVTENGENTKLSFYYGEDLGMPYIENKNNLEVYFWGGGGIAWAADTKKVTEMENATRYIEYDSAGKYATTKNSRFYLQGALELLDIPGEFYYDKAEGDLYYYPKNLPIEEQEIAVPSHHNFIEFIGESIDKPIRNIKLEGIELNTSDRDFDGIYMNCARNIEIDSVHLLNIGGNGVKMEYYSYANKVKNSEIGNIGNFGIQIANGVSELTTTMYGKFNEISNCEVYSVGRMDGEGNGISLSDVGYNVVKNCIVHDSHRMGIQWSSKRPGSIIGKAVDGVKLDRTNVRIATHSQNNLMMFNEIYDVMNDSQDGGAIYSWGGDVDNVVAYNHIHDTMTPFSEGHGIYLDDAADVVTVKKNIVDNMYREGFVGATMSSIFAKGINHYVDNNFVVESPNNMYACMTETMVGEPCYDQSWYRNVVSNSGPYTYYNKAYSLNRFKMTNYNFYYNETDEYKVYLGGYRGTIANDIYEWKNWFNNSKYDQFSEIDTDPAFYDSKNRDYRLKYDSETYKLGITDIDEGDIGLTADYPYKKQEELRKLYLDTSDERIYGSTVNLGIGEEIEIKPYARTAVSGYIVDAKAYEYSVADENIAVIDQNGNLKGLSKGITKLTIEYEGLKLEYDVLVGDKIREAILYSQPTETILAGNTIPTNYYLKTEFGQTVKQFLSAEYKSADETVATVDEEGNVTGVSAGETEITAEISDGVNTMTAAMHVKVLDKAISSIRIKDDELLTIVREKSETFTPEFEVVYSDESVGTFNAEKATFKSLNEEVFSVDEKGVLTGHMLGKSKLSVAYEEDGITKYAGFEVRVREKALTAGEFIWASSCDDSYGPNVSATDMTYSVSDNDADEWLHFKDVDFGGGGWTELWTSFSMTNKYGGKIVQWRLDSLDGPIVAEIKTTASGAWGVYLEQQGTILKPELLKGVHDVYICYTAGGTGNHRGFVFK